MTPVDQERQRWLRTQELLNALEAVPAADREDHLATLCPDDPELRREVSSLLAAETASEGFLRRVATNLGMEPARPETPDLTGRRIGAYRLLHPLGRGGMGVVYKAERADGAFAQQVALKLLTTALAGSEAHDRFLAERQILAGLENPAIAHMVDGGVTEDGTPWFAMEYVDGQAIDAYCDLQRLDLRQRLELFLQVCDAVEHAHRRLIVHRDLKPANVLVTEERQVKLLDFGIAKLLEGEGTKLATPPTRTAMRMMTPEYASPEQVRGEPVTTASDVYQLGLLLYVLLTGHRPYSLRQRHGGELERVICGQAPVPPSAAVTRLDTLAPSTAADGWTVEDAHRARRASVARLRRGLRGDLDNIVLMALRKEPERRYGSADRLAQDLRRHLSGLPVTARPDTWAYRGRKFLRRHAVGASAAIALLALVGGMTGLYTVRIQRERDRAQAEALKAQQVSQFLTGLFRSSDPRQAQGAELTARELLDRGVAQVDRDLAAQPDVQAEMLRVLARTYLELGLFDSAQRLLTRARELLEPRLGRDHPVVAGILRDLGLLRYQRGEYGNARGLLEESARIFEAAPGGDAAELADVLGVLGQTYRRLGEYEQGLATLERALAIQARASGQESEPAALILDRLGALLAEMGDLERAEALYQRALAVHERELGAAHPLVGNVLMNLAAVRMVQGKLTGLEPMYRRSLAIKRNAYGPDHAEVGTALNNLGHFLTVSQRHDEAVEVLERALETYSAALGPQNPRLALPLTSLADTHLSGGRPKLARTYYRHSVEVREKAVGADDFDPLLFHSLTRLGRIDVELGDTVAGERSLHRALAMWSQAREPEDSRIAPSLADLGRWLSERQLCAEALPLLQRAIKIESAWPDPTGARAVELKGLLGNCSGQDQAPVENANL